jgi:hypothetical protein
VLNLLSQNPKEVNWPNSFVIQRLNYLVFGLILRFSNSGNCITEIKIRFEETIELGFVLKNTFIFGPSFYFVN